jgi:hypothetical protein
MYRCRTPDGKLAFQDQPCASGAVQSTLGTPAGPDVEPKVRPVEGMSAEQRADYDALVKRYIQVFRVIGRAKACNAPDAEERFQALARRVRQRHPDNDPALYAVTVGYSAGNESRAVAELGETKPPPQERCEMIVGPLQRAALPPVPASIIEKADQPVDLVRKDGRAPGGPYRFLSRTPYAGGAAEQLLIYRDRIVFRSTEPFEDRFDLMGSGPTPVVLFATLNLARKCGDGKPYRTWHAVSLPANGASVVTRVDADCVQLSMRPEGFCAASRFYRITDGGELIAAGECPRS